MRIAAGSILGGEGDEVIALGIAAQISMLMPIISPTRIRACLRVKTFQPAAAARAIALPLHDHVAAGGRNSNPVHRIAIFIRVSRARADAAVKRAQIDLGAKRPILQVEHKHLLTAVGQSRHPGHPSAIMGQLIIGLIASYPVIVGRERISGLKHIGVGVQVLRPDGSIGIGIVKNQCMTKRRLPARGIDVANSARRLRQGIYPTHNVIFIFNQKNILIVRGKRLKLGIDISAKAAIRSAIGNAAKSRAKDSIPKTLI